MPSRPAREPSAPLSLIDGTQMVLSENARVTVDQYVYDPNNSSSNKGRYNFLEGAFQYVSGFIAKTPDPDVNMETPTNTSAFRILSATLEGDDVLVKWIFGGGRTNVLQSATCLNGNWSTTSPAIVLTGSGDVTMNYLDIGAATNSPARYYRVQLIP